MAGIGNQTLQGYILEEVLAYLIRNSGYRLLVDPRQDPSELDLRGNGLVVKGRGAVHQVDVLGELEWVPAFTFPLRLFVEAKFRASATGIHEVRNAVGVLLDINQNNAPRRDQDTILQKYQYVYALFSTSGFSKPAQDMALAHQISLIDLSGSEYEKLKDSISNSATEILSEGSDLSRTGGQNLVLEVRHALRKELKTQPEGIPLDESTFSQAWIVRKLSQTIQTAREYGELFVAMVNGPYMLLLKPANPRDFLDYCTSNPTHKVAIHWADDAEAPWHLRPTEAHWSYELSFSLPPCIREWVFEATRDVRRRALSVKRELFSNITVYYRNADRDFLFRLEFDPESVPERRKLDRSRSSFV